MLLLDSRRPAPSEIGAVNRKKKVFDRAAIAPLPFNPAVLLVLYCFLCIDISRHAQDESDTNPVICKEVLVQSQSRYYRVVILVAVPFLSKRRSLQRTTKKICRNKCLGPKVVEHLFQMSEQFDRFTRFGLRLTKYGATFVSSRFPNIFVFDAQPRQNPSIAQVGFCVCIQTSEIHYSNTTASTSTSTFLTTITK